PCTSLKLHGSGSTVPAVVTINQISEKIFSAAVEGYLSTAAFLSTSDLHMLHHFDKMPTP
ncbi:MAG: hypothetical protein IKT79_00245, partial [Akkermansia sp.]|nr:hypothetical protein [Akkermansia sp.]